MTEIDCIRIAFRELGIPEDTTEQCIKCSLLIVAPQMEIKDPVAKIKSIKAQLLHMALMTPEQFREKYEEHRQKVSKITGIN